MTKRTFSGETFDPALDGERLTSLLERVKAAMHGGTWATLGEIQAACGGTEASISARLRDLRKERFGGYTVERRRVADANGLWEYRVLPAAPKGQVSLFNKEPWNYGV